MEDGAKTGIVGNFGDSSDRYNSHLPWAHFQWMKPVPETPETNTIRQSFLP